jgi:hypothetical protein
METGINFPASMMSAGSSVPMGATDDAPRGKTAKETKQLQDDALLKQVNSWWDESRQFHAANRYEQMRDSDFYDHHQFTEQQAREILNRGQFPSVYNLVAVAIDWIIGTERRTRVEGKVHPRKPSDVEGALAKGELIKYVDDVNQAGFERSRAFDDAAKVGVGWTEECVVRDTSNEPLTILRQDWKEMWWDPYSKRDGMQDCRYMHRRRWTDLDYAIAMFPEARDQLQGLARSFNEMDVADSDDLCDVPAMFLQNDLMRHGEVGYTIFGTSSTDQKFRRRLPLTETWYRKPRSVKRLLSIDPDLNNEIYNEAEPNPDHVAALKGGWATTTDGVEEDICIVVWIPKLILSHEVSPYKHKQFPFTPIWCKRDGRTNLPYGYVRGMRDAQLDFNKRRQKALFLLSVNRVLYEDGAIEKADEDEFLDECARPDAKLKFKKGALNENRVKFEWGHDMVPAQIQLGQEAKEHILEGSGVTRENLGQDSNAQSGRAIQFKQSQGSVTTAELFDNYRRFMQTSNQKSLSNIEQFMSLPKQIRIAGQDGKPDWLMVNEPQQDPLTGELFFKNDLTAQEADYVIDQQDFRETVRMALAEQLLDLIGKMPAQVQLPLLDIAVEMMDIPNREAIVARIRSVTGSPPLGQENSPEVIAQKQAQAQQQQRMSDLDAQERGAKVQATLANAAKLSAQAKHIAVQGKAAALDTAGMVQAALPLAPAADRIYEAPPAPPHAVQQAPSIPASDSPPPE